MTLSVVWAACASLAASSFVPPSPSSVLVWCPSSRVVDSSTRDPPPEQLLVGLGAGGASSIAMGLVGVVLVLVLALTVVSRRSRPCWRCRCRCLVGGGRVVYVVGQI